jgi:O-antigen/teichoic acid export membrane protein
MPILNSLYIILSKSTFILAYFLISIVVARTLGTTEFGIYALILSVYTMFELLGTLGIENIIVREISKEHSKSDVFFTHGAILLFISSIICFLMMTVIGPVMQYDDGIKHLLVLAGTVLFPTFLYFLLENTLIAFQKAKYVFWAAACRDSFLLVGGYWVLSQGQGIKALIMVMLIARTIGLGIIFLFAKHERIQLFSKVKWDFLKRMIQIIPTFALIGLSTSLFLEADTLILSKILPFSELGIYSLAKRVYRLGSVVYFSVGTAFFPLISQAFSTSRHKLEILFRDLIIRVLGLSLLLVIFVLLCSRFFINLFFGQEYVVAMPYLQILIWALIPFGLEFLLSRFLIAGHRQKENLWCLGCGIGCLLLTGISFSVQWQGRGMAAAYTLSTCFMATIAYYFTRRLLNGFEPS